jgi:hypothetical protein
MSQQNSDGFWDSKQTVFDEPFVRRFCQFHVCSKKIKNYLGKNSTHLYSKYSCPLYSLCTWPAFFHILHGLALLSTEIRHPIRLAAYLLRTVAIELEEKKILLTCCENKVLSRFELCRRTQQPSLTSCLVGGSTFGLWPLFHLRDGGKWTEITATQHGGTLRH